MTWLQRYRVRHYVGNSVWILPALSALAAIAAVRLLHWIEQDLGWASSLDPGTAGTVLATVAASLFTCIVFVCTALLVAVQLASAALTPRIIALVFRDPVTKFSMTLLVFTFTFSLGALIRIKGTVPLLTAHVAAYVSLVSLGVFFYLIDHLGKAVRPSGAFRAVARLGSKVIESSYPQSFAETQNGTQPAAADVTGDKAATTILSRKDGVLLAFDPKGLLS